MLVSCLLAYSLRACLKVGEGVCDLCIHLVTVTTVATLCIAMLAFVVVCMSAWDLLGGHVEPMIEFLEAIGVWKGMKGFAGAVFFS